MLVVPSIDILSGKVVRLSKGDYSNPTVYNDSALNQAVVFNDHGFDKLHIVDLQGSRNGVINVIEDLYEIRRKTDMELQFGGGVRTFDDIDTLISMGVSSIVVGSITVKNKSIFEQFVEDYGIDQFVVAVDVNEDKLAIKGWTQKTEITLSDHISYCLNLGIDTFLCTDISRDGLLNGPNFELYKSIQEEFPGIKLFASGGVRDMDDLFRLKDIDMHGVIIGRAIYENNIELEELSEFAGKENNSMS